MRTVIFLYANLALATQQENKNHEEIEKNQMLQPEITRLNLLIAHKMNELQSQKPGGIDLNLFQSQLN